MSPVNLCIEGPTLFHGHAGLAATSTCDQYAWQDQEIDVVTRDQGTSHRAEVQRFDAGAREPGKTVDIGETPAQQVGGIAAWHAALQATGATAETLSAGKTDAHRCRARQVAMSDMDFRPRMRP